MNLGTLSQQVRQISDRYAASNDIERDRAWYALKVSEEAGEVAKAFVTLVGQGRSKMPPAEAREKLADELADLVAHAILLAVNENIDIEDAIRRKWLSYL